MLRAGTAPASIRPRPPLVSGGSPARPPPRPVPVTWLGPSGPASATRPVPPLESATALFKVCERDARNFRADPFQLFGIHPGPQSGQVDRAARWRSRSLAVRRRTASAGDPARQELRIFRYELLQIFLGRHLALIAFGDETSVFASTDVVLDGLERQIDFGYSEPLQFGAKDTFALCQLGHRLTLPCFLSQLIDTLLELLAPLSLVDQLGLVSRLLTSDLRLGELLDRGPDDVPDIALFHVVSFCCSAPRLCLGLVETLINFRNDPVFDLLLDVAQILQRQAFVDLALQCGRLNS